MPANPSPTTVSVSNSDITSQHELVIPHEYSGQNAQPKKQRIKTDISQEEYRTIIDKLRSVLQLPPGTLDKQSELYLEQQLSEILGFEVATELEQRRLPFTTGVMAALPHQKRFPGDELSLHKHHLESGFNHKRSAFGWVTEDASLKEKSINQERYTISVPIAYLPNWQEELDSLKSWFARRQVVVVNPFEERAVVGVIGDIKFDEVIKFQFGGSPELIRDGLVWSPASQGKVLVLFTDDKDQPDLGLYKLKAPVV